jgi:cell division transport system ATP-binding protein
MIEFQNVSVCYDPGARHPATAIVNLSLQINAGEWVFLVGPSGAGKSTLLKLLHCGVPTSARVEGRVLLNGQDITHLPSREVPFVRRKIGVVFQDFQLLAQKTAWENIAFALRVIGEKQSRIAREVPRALDIVGLAHRAHAQPHELSGGEQQRIAIARAIVNNPALLLTDEPTGNLDPDTAAGIAAVLQRINEECGTTVLMATHDRPLVDSLRKRVVRVRDGYIISDEASGVYHPEDDDPASDSASSRQPVGISLNSTNGVAASEKFSEEPKAPTSKIEVSKIETTKAQVPKTQAPKTDEPRESIRIAETDVPTTSTSVSKKDAPAVDTPTISIPTVSVPVVKAPIASTPVARKVRVSEPQDAITREALQSGAPLGSDENPIVQYGRK